MRRLTSLVARIHRQIPTAGPDHTLNTIATSTQRPGAITSTQLREFMRSTCALKGGKVTFGFDPADIGTKSLRSGAAMSLFLSNHSVHKIMLLGRWSSDAFLVYIRPQVLEWTDNMSDDMIKHDNFWDATDSRRTSSEDPRTRTNDFNAGKLRVPIRLHIHQ